MEEFVQDSDAPAYFVGERRKTIQPVSLTDSRLVKLKEVLVQWINSTLKSEHIVVQALEEDLYDGLVLHHLLSKLGGVCLQVEEIAVSSAAQMRKLEVILQALNEDLGIGPETDTAAKWSVKLIHSRDLLSTLHLLVAMVKRYNPNLVLPPNVSVEVILLEVNKSGIKSEKQIEHITAQSENTDGPSNSKSKDPIDEVLRLDEYKIATVKKAIFHFVNKNMSALRLQVTDLEKQFADGVILLLLIGELEGFFIPLYAFYLSPSTHSEMLHNVTLALDILSDRGMTLVNVDPEDIVSQDVAATLKVLYALFQRHKYK